MPQHLPLTGAFGVCGFLHLGIYAVEANARRRNEERRRHKSLRQHDGGSCERQADAERSQRPAQHTAPAEGRQQGNAGDGRRRTIGKINQHFDQCPAAEPPTRQNKGQRRAQDQGKPGCQQAGYRLTRMADCTPGFPR